MVTLVADLHKSVDKIQKKYQHQRSQNEVLAKDIKTQAKTIKEQSGIIKKLRASGKKL